MAGAVEEGGGLPEQVHLSHGVVAVEQVEEVERSIDLEDDVPWKGEAEMERKKI